MKKNLSNILLMAFGALIGIVDLAFTVLITLKLTAFGKGSFIDGKNYMIISILFIVINLVVFLSLTGYIFYRYKKSKKA